MQVYMDTLISVRENINKELRVLVITPSVGEDTILITYTWNRGRTNAYLQVPKYN